MHPQKYLKASKDKSEIRRLGKKCRLVGRVVQCLKLPETQGGSRCGNELVSGE